MWSDTPRRVGPTIVAMGFASLYEMNPAKVPDADRVGSSVWPLWIFKIHSRVKRQTSTREEELQRDAERCYPIHLPNNSVEIFQQRIS